MKTVKAGGWHVTVSCIVNCEVCGASNVDASCGTVAQCVAEAKREGWRLVRGRPVCSDCLIAEPKPARSETKGEDHA